MVGGQPRKVLWKFHNGQDVLVTGWVPEIEPYVQQAAVTIAPLRLTAGMQNKVALSLSLGVPVVATPGAFKRFYVSEMAKWSKTIQQANITDE
jgi:hypothetical protein